MPKMTCDICFKTRKVVFIDPDTETAYCQDCFDNNFFKCADCNKILPLHEGGMDLTA